MKFTSFQPLILTKDAESAIKVFEALGFEKRHAPVVVSNSKEIKTVCMKNADGFAVDVAQIDGLPQDKTLIRMNVDNFDEAYEFLKSKGFKFERRHMKTGISDDNVTSVSMKDENGFHVDVTKLDKIPKDITSIRMNVSDFDEAFELLTAHGFTNAQGEKITDTGSSKATMMVSPTGFTISLVKHIKK